jgi:hypothetical protein
MATFYADPALGGSSATYTDDANPITGLDNYGYVERLVPMFADGINITSFAAGRATAAADSASAAAASATSALNAPGTNATSTTSLTVGTGSKSLTIQTGKAYSIGQVVVIASTASPGNQMTGIITAYTSGTGALVVDVQQTLGSGTLAAWTISLGALVSSTLPSQTGNSGKFLTTNGTAASWGDALVPSGNLAGLSNYTTARTNLGLTIGTNVQAYDADLAAIAGLTSAADRLPYFTGSGTAALATFTSAGRALVDDADASAQRATLGLVIGTNVQAYDVKLGAFAGLTLAADKLPYATGPSAMATTDLSAFARTILDDANAGAVRSTISAAASGANNDITSLDGLTTAAMQAILAGGVIGSLAQSGYVNVGGFLFQWGRYAGGSSSPTISFPLAFPVECFVVVPAAVGFSADANTVSSSSVHHVALRGSPTTSSFQAWCSFENEASDVFAASTNTAFHWIAVGY